MFQPPQPASLLLKLSTQTSSENSWIIFTRKPTRQGPKVLKPFFFLNTLRDSSEFLMFLLCFAISSFSGFWVPPNFEESSYLSYLLSQVLLAYHVFVKCSEWVLRKLREDCDLWVCNLYAWLWISRRGDENAISCNLCIQITFSLFKFLS